MGAPVKKLFGSLSLDGIKKAVTEVPAVEKSWRVQR